MVSCNICLEDFDKTKLILCQMCFFNLCFDCFYKIFIPKNVKVSFNFNPITGETAPDINIFGNCINCPQCINNEISININSFVNDLLFINNLDEWMTKKISNDEFKMTLEYEQINSN